MLYSVSKRSTAFSFEQKTRKLGKYDERKCIIIVNTVQDVIVSSIFMECDVQLFVRLNVKYVLQTILFSFYRDFFIVVFLEKATKNRQIRCFCLFSSHQSYLFSKRKITKSLNVDSLCVAQWCVYGYVSMYRFNNRKN